MSRLASVLAEHTIRSAGWPATTGGYFLSANRIVVMTPLRSDVRLMQLPLLIFLCYPSYHARILVRKPTELSTYNELLRAVFVVVSGRRCVMISIVTKRRNKIIGIRPNLGRGAKPTMDIMIFKL
jgi:hypothetical protein